MASDEVTIVIHLLHPNRRRKHQHFTMELVMLSF